MGFPVFRGSNAKREVKRVVVCFDFFPKRLKKWHFENSAARVRRGAAGFFARHVDPKL